MFLVKLEGRKNILCSLVVDDIFYFWGHCQLHWSVKEKTKCGDKFVLKVSLLKVAHSTNDSLSEVKFYNFTLN